MTFMFVLFFLPKPSVAKCGVTFIGVTEGIKLNTKL